MSDPIPASEIGRRARSAVDKIDAQGVRGVTLRSMEEIEAMALVCALSGLLPPPPASNETQTPQSRS